MIRHSKRSAARAFSAALALSLIYIDSASAETYQWHDSTAVIEQRGGDHTSQSQIFRFGNGQRIITRDGNSTDVTIQQRGGVDITRTEPQPAFSAGNNRFDVPDFERPLSQNSRADPHESFGELPETSLFQRFFLLHILERLE